MAKSGKKTTTTSPGRTTTPQSRTPRANTRAQTSQDTSRANTRTQTSNDSGQQEGDGHILSQDTVDPTANTQQGGTLPIPEGMTPDEYQGISSVMSGPSVLFRSYEKILRLLKTQFPRLSRKTIAEHDKVRARCALEKEHTRLMVEKTRNKEERRQKRTDEETRDD